MSSHTTLYIRVESAEKAHDRISKRLGEIDAGADVEDHFELILTSKRELARVLSEKNMELIETIAAHEPTSMRETARLVGRNIADVSTNLNELESLGVIKFDQDGRSKRPVIWYDDINVEIRLPRGNTSEEAPA